MQEDDGGASGGGGASGSGKADAPLTLDALGKIIQETSAELSGKLSSMQSDQELAGETLQQMARSHRRMRRRVIRFLDSMAAVYQRQQAISTRLTEIESWQALHTKDHRDSMPPPVASRGRRPKSKRMVGRG